MRRRRAGPHVVSIRPEAENTLRVVLAKGEIRYVRTKVALGAFVGHVIAELVEEAQARRALAATSYTGGVKGRWAAAGAAPALPRHHASAMRLR